ALRPFRLGLEPRAGAAPFRAERARGVDDVRVVPRARLEAVVARGDGAHRADVHQVAREQRVHALLSERRDLAAGPAIDHADLRITLHLAHEADASRAQDAAV